MAAELKQPISWRPDFATGVAIIDDQHRVLINMLNDVGARLTEHSPVEDYARIVQGLLNYADYHFHTEECLITKHGYHQACAEQAATHLRQHKEFSEYVVAARARISTGQRLPKDELVDFLTHWLTNHILRTDKAFGAFVRDQQAPGAGGKA